MVMSSPFQPSTPTGVMTAAVPQPNTSRSVPARCAAISSSIPSGRSLTISPQSRSNVITASRVIPARMLPSSGGVMNSSPMRTMTFIVPTSSRYVCSCASVHNTCA